MEIGRQKLSYFFLEHGKLSLIEAGLSKSVIRLTGNRDRISDPWTVFGKLLKKIENPLKKSENSLYRNEKSHEVLNFIVKSRQKSEICSASNPNYNVDYTPSDPCMRVNNSTYHINNLTQRSALYLWLRIQHLINFLTWLIVTLKNNNLQHNFITHVNLTQFVFPCTHCSSTQVNKNCC